MNKIFKYGVIFEIFLVFIAMWIAHIFEKKPFLFQIQTDLKSILFTLGMAILAMTLGVFLTSHQAREIPFFKEVGSKAKQALKEFLPGMTPIQIVILSLAAGIGEEVLFRGTLDPLIGIYFSALIFGLLHSLSYAYFIFATLLGLGLSSLYFHYPNLLPLIAFHFCFDAVVLFRYKRQLKCEKSQVLKNPSLE